MDDSCVICGRYIPEGCGFVCLQCEKNILGSKENKCGEELKMLYDLIVKSKER